jgi:HK97 family phage major capsid protein
MTEQEKAAQDALISKLKSEVENLIAEKGFAKNNEIESLKSQLEGLTKKDEIEAIKNEVIKLAADLSTSNESRKANKVSFNEALKAAIDEKSEEIKAILANGGKQNAPLVFEVKSAVDMTTVNTIGAGATQVSLTEDTGIISPIRKRAEKYLANVSVGSISGNRAMWIEETDEQGNPVFIAEGSGKTKLSVLYVEKTAQVKKIAVYGKVTTEMLADLPQLISYIQNNLVKRLGVKVEDQLLTGDNIGDNLNGMETVASAFAAGAAANTITFANEWDVLNAVATQVEIANGIPNVVFVHPRTLQAMKAAKDQDGAPLWKKYQDGNGEIIVSGMKVVSTTAITEGNFVGGDGSVANVLFREELNVQIGLDGNDFINNKKTILVESRLTQFVSANDVPVVVKGDFATAKAALLLV